MIDAVFALVLILSVVFGAKRGLFRSFMALAAIVLALIGASLLTDALTEPVTDMLMPRLEKSVEEWFDTESQTPQGDVPQIEGETPAESDASGETPNGDAAQNAENARQDDSPLAVTGLLKKLLRLVTGGIDKVLDLPVLNALNTIGGGALGLIEGALLLFLVCDVAPKLGVKAFADYEGTYLLSFFMSHTPRGLVAALLP